MSAATRARNAARAGRQTPAHGIHSYAPQFVPDNKEYAAFVALPTPTQCYPT